MLAPDRRTSYTDALRPPPGWRFDQAVAATYSLDLATLLAFPLQLALDLADREGEAVLRDGVVLLEALRRTTERLTVFCEQSQIHAPSIAHVLFSLLEPVIREVRAPNGGSFHPKFWLLRFVSGEDAMLRLVIPTRNITTDRCWDLVLSIEGMPGRRPRAANRPLRDLLEALPSLSVGEPDSSLVDRMRAIADEVHRADWMLPPGFDDISFHVLGLRNRKWTIPESDRLVVMSPFLTQQALEDLVESTWSPVALISRAEELAMIPASTLSSFEGLRVLLESTIPDDASESLPTEPPRVGLHAKAYILEAGRYTHALIGSANATSAGLFGPNVEILAELIGPSRRVGGIDDLLGADSMGAVLGTFDPPPEPLTPDVEVQAALDALRQAQRALASAGMHVECVSTGDLWTVRLIVPRPMSLAGIESIRAWPVSLREANAAVDAAAIMSGGTVVWPPASIHSLTGFFAFELTASAAEQSVRFVLSLPVMGLPVSERDSAIIRSVLANREGFLRYLLLLLGEDDHVFEGLPPALDGNAGQSVFGSWKDGVPLLEEMTRALHRDPSRLSTIKRLMKQLESKSNGSDDIIPREFLELWLVFEEVLAEVGS